MDDQTVAQQQDVLRVARAFIGALSGGSGDQNYSSQDPLAINPPGQFVVLGPQGVAVEGRSTIIGAAPGGGLVISPTLVLIVLGVIAWKFVK